MNMYVCMYVYIYTYVYTYTYIQCWLLISVGVPSPNNLGILCNVQISWVSGVNNKKSLDKKGFSIEINLRSIDFPFKPQTNLLIRKGFN